MRCQVGTHALSDLFLAICVAQLHANNESLLHVHASDDILYVSDDMMHSMVQLSPTRSARASDGTGGGGGLLLPGLLD